MFTFRSDSERQRGFTILRIPRNLFCSSGLLTPFGGRVLQRFRGGSFPKISAPAASIWSQSFVHQTGTEESTKQTLGTCNMRENGGKIQRDVRRDGAPNDDLRAVLDKLWGVEYTYKYIKCIFAGKRPFMPLQCPQRAEYARRRRFFSILRFSVPGTALYLHTLGGFSHHRQVLWRLRTGSFESGAGAEVRKPVFLSVVAKF